MSEPNAVRCMSKEELFAYREWYLKPRVSGEQTLRELEQEIIRRYPGFVAAHMLTQPTREG